MNYLNSILFSQIHRFYCWAGPQVGQAGLQAGTAPEEAGLIAGPVRSQAGLWPEGAGHTAGSGRAVGRGGGHARVVTELVTARSRASGSERRRRDELQRSPPQLTLAGVSRGKRACGGVLVRVGDACIVHASWSGQGVGAGTARSRAEARPWRSGKWQMIESSTAQI